MSDCEALLCRDFPEDETRRMVAESLPRLTLCLVGDENFLNLIAPALPPSSFEHQWQRHDPSLAQAFAASACEIDFAQIDRHTHVLYLRSEPIRADQAVRICGEMLCLGVAVLEGGGWAMKCDSSGVAHSSGNWIHLAQQAALGYQRVAHEIGTPRDILRDRTAYLRTLFHAFVQLPLDVYSVSFTCGMHLLGQPDLILNSAELSDSLHDLQPNEVAELFEAFALHLLADHHGRRFEDGQLFRANEHAPRFQMSWEKCAGYCADDLRHNPFGRWRFARVVK